MADNADRKAALDAVAWFAAVLEDRDDIEPRAFHDYISWEDVEALFEMVVEAQQLCVAMGNELDARGGWTEELAQKFHEALNR